MGLSRYNILILILFWVISLILHPNTRCSSSILFLVGISLYVCFITLMVVNAVNVLFSSLVGDTGEITEEKVQER